MSPAKPHSKEQLVWLQMKNGSEPALVHLYDQYVDMLYNYGRKFTTQSEIIEDAIQELITELWQKKERLSLPDSVKAYLYKAFRQKLFRQLAKFKQVPLPESDFNNQHWEQNDYLSTTILSETELSFQAKLQKALDALSPKEREVLSLRFAENLSHDEIVKIMGIKKQTLYNLMHNALHKLSKTLSGEKNAAFVYLLLYFSCISLLSLLLIVVAIF